MRQFIVPILLFICAVASASAQQIDITKSIIRIHVGKSGVFSAAGHEHWVTARIASGELSRGVGAHISFSVDALQMKVEPDKKLSASDQAEVQRTMQTKVLETDKYPRIVFHSTKITQSGPDNWDVTGELALHGRQREVHAAVTSNNGQYVGHARIKQTDFGIEPVKVGGGLVRVKDELDIEFTIVATT